jgi:hypothetical protein
MKVKVCVLQFEIAGDFKKNAEKREATLSRPIALILP